MNKQTFLNAFPESVSDPSVQRLADLVDALDRIQQTYINKAWWLNAWYFIPNMFWMRNGAKQSQLSVLRQTAQSQISEQVNLISTVITDNKIDDRKLVTKVMGCIIEAFTTIASSKSEAKDFVSLTPTWFSWGDFVDSLAEKFSGITVEIAKDDMRSRRIAFTPPSDTASSGTSSTLILSAAAAANDNGSRRGSIRVRAGFKASF